MDGTKRKVTVQLTYDNNETTRPPPRSRPPSPLKQTVSAPSPSTSTFRPKAKVNSSATPLSIARKPTKASNTPSAKFGSLGRTATFSDTSNGSASRANASPTPRARSPVRPPARPASASSLSVQPKSRPTVTRSTLRPPASQSTPGTPDTLYHPTLPSSPNVGLERTRPRHVSVSLHHQVSFSSLNSPAAPSSDLGFMPQHGSNGKSPPNGAPKITAKLSRLAVHDEGSPSPSPSLPASRPNVPRTRAPSMTSTISRSSTAQSSTAPSSSASESVFYPITTATAAANPYRYATARATPTNSRHHYAHPFIAPHDDVNVNYTRGGSPARVDPSLIPLPPNSPPTSALSFSSRSSVSQSSASYAESGDSQSSPPTQHNGMTGKFNSALESLVQISSSVSPREDSFSGTSGNDRDSTSGLDTSERKVKAEAKSNRKIEDLEITNRSLLAINASLEAAKHRQAKEIRELRRKLRESRLILPPKVYRAVTSSADRVETDDDDDGDDEAEQENEEKPAEGPGDETYSRVRLLVEGLIDSGKRALMTQPSDFVEAVKGGAKVLSAEEVRHWRDSGIDPSAFGDKPPISPSLVAVPDSDDGLDSEDEVEAMTIPDDSPPPRSPSPLPPILLTEPH